MSDRDDPRGSDPKGDNGDKPKLTEMMRDFALGGLATYFMTEDAIRGYLKDLKLPKELVGVVLEGIGKKKEDFYGLLVKEFGRVLNKVDITQEVSKFLELHRIHVEAKFSFEPKKTDGPKKTGEPAGEMKAKIEEKE